MHICLVYDCLYPHTVGGAERWYRNLAERLAADGHEVTYLTLRQWDRKEPPSVPGVRVVACGPRMRLYDGAARRILPPLVFGAGVLWHLLRHGGRFDVVHTASFPYFSLLAAGAARRVHDFRLVTDWFEVWTLAYWRAYLGRRAGWLGWRVQRLCARIDQHAFCFSDLHAERLQEEGFRGEITRLRGIYAGSRERPQPAPARPAVVFAGRHIPEKRVPALVRAFAEVRRTLPDLRLELYGDGPRRAEAIALVEELGLSDVVAAPGFVEEDRVREAVRTALCNALPSRREGYGLVVVEAAALGTPSVVVADPDSAASELIEEGANGTVAASAEPGDLAAAIERVHAAGRALRESTADWFARNAERLSLERSLEAVSAAYRGGA